MECQLYIPWLSAAMAFTVQAIDAAAIEVFGDGRNGSTQPVNRDWGHGARFLVAVSIDSQISGDGRWQRVNRRRRKSSAEASVSVALFAICQVSKLSGSPGGVAGCRRCPFGGKRIWGRCFASV